MASTGLLTGINPYRQQRTTFDISSKPLNIAVQLEQKEQAKRDALDKYFMDYERSINPAGVRKQEADVFMQKLAENKAFYLKNRDAILNPAKYGYDAQSQYMGNYKDMINLISQSKKAAAEDKALSTILNQAKMSGKKISDNVFDMLENSRKPIGFGYQAPDASLLQIYNPHNEKEFTTNVWGGVDLPKREVFVDEVINNKKTGRVIKQTYQDINDDVVKNAALGAVNEYRNKLGTQEYFDKLLEDKAYTSQINNVFKNRFKRDIQTGEDLAIGYALTQKPGGLIKTEAPEYSWLSKFNMQQGAINARADKYKGLAEEGNLLDLIPDINLASGGKVSGGVAFDQNGAPLNGEIYLEKENLPTEWFSVIGNPKGVKGFNVKFVDGNPEKISNPKVGNITRQSMINYQRKYNTEPKNAPQLDFGKGSGKGKSNYGNIKFN